MSEALIFASSNPQYDDRLFIELQVQYLHENYKLKPGENKLCTEIVYDIQNNFCTQHVLPMFCKKKSFWQRFTCTENNALPEYFPTNYQSYFWNGKTRDALINLINFTKMSQLSEKWQHVGICNGLTGFGSVLTLIATKGQLISEWLLNVFIWTKKQTKIFLYFCPTSLK